MTTMTREHLGDEAWEAFLDDIVLAQAEARERHILSDTLTIAEIVDRYLDESCWMGEQAQMGFTEYTVEEAWALAQDIKAKYPDLRLRLGTQDQILGHESFESDHALEAAPSGAPDRQPVVAGSFTASLA